MTLVGGVAVVAGMVGVAARVVNVTSPHAFHVLHMFCLILALDTLAEIRAWDTGLITFAVFFQAM